MIKITDLKKINALHAAEVKTALESVVDSGWYLRGSRTATFEQQYAAYIGTKHCVGCGNGLDALTLILRAYIEMGVLKRGDEVIVPANTYIASILAVTRNGLKPILVEPNLDTLQIDDNLLERAITERTRAVMIVHLYGRCAYTDRIGRVCKQHGLKLIEDNAQAHGCSYNGKRTGSLGDAAAHSFYPTKNIGSLGDAGAITTDDEQIAELTRAIANYGSGRKYEFQYTGINSRMDETQAAVLSVKLKYIDDENKQRRANALRYIKEVNNALLAMPDEKYYDNNVFHIFPLRCCKRDKLQQWLADRGVQTDVHYPIPPHKQPCYACWNNLSLPITEKIHAEELSIPVNNTLTPDEVSKVIELLNLFEL